MQIVIMAGGKGTRIASVNSEVPKPMIRILDKPILEYQIDCMRNQGYKDIIIVVGHLGNVIQDYFKDGSDFGVNIKYIVEDQPLGTAGALFLLKDQLKDDFLLVNGDIIFDINIKRFYNAHKEKGGLATLFTHPNSHPYDSGIIISDEDGCVKKWLNKEDERKWYKNRVNAGIHMISNDIFREEVKIFESLRKLDLDRDVLKTLIESKQLYIYDSPEYVKDMGTPDRYYSVIIDIKMGRVKSKNLNNKQKAIFLDRDGTINKYVGFLRNIDDFILLPGVAEAIRKINESGYLAIVVTNQPVIARGEVSWNELDCIHNKMETLLGEEKAYLDGIYFCPHHPNKGFEGEKRELKIECNCRKPKPGLLLKAADDFNINLEESWMVGDSKNDILSGQEAGCKTAYIGEEDKELTPNFRNLLEFVNEIL